MFDKLIESNSAAADFKTRRKFFMSSAVVVGILFVSSVLFDLFAADIDLGTDNFELVQILAPIETDVPKAEPPRQEPQRQPDQTPQTELPNRPVLIQRMDVTPRTPTEISTTRNPYEAMPEGTFTNNPNLPESNGRGAPGASGGV